MQIDQLAEELSEIKQCQNSSEILRERVAQGLDDRVADALNEVGFGNVNTKGYNALFYHSKGYIFKINAGCQGCCYYDYEWRYSLIKVGNPDDENDVKWALRGADSAGQVNRRIGPISVLGGVIAGAAAYPILEIFYKPGLENVLGSYLVGSIAFALSLVINVGYFDYRCNKATTKTLADNSYDAIEKVREIFSPGC